MKTNPECEAFMKVEPTPTRREMIEDLTVFFSLAEFSRLGGQLQILTERLQVVSCYSQMSVSVLIFGGPRVHWVRQITVNHMIMLSL